MNSDYQELHEKLELFLQEALPISEKNVNPSKYDKKSYHLESKDGNEVIIGSDERNWNSFDVVGHELQIRNLKSYFTVVEICKKIPQITKHDKKGVSAFCIGYDFSIIDIPIQFLRTHIFLERGYFFQKSRFEYIF